MPGWSYDWRRCGAPHASEFSYFGYPYSGSDSGSYDPGYPSGDYDSCLDDSGHQATMTSAPTTPLSYPFQMEESSPPLQWNYPIYEGKGEDMLLQMSKGISSTAEYTGVPTTPPMPRPAGVESPPPPPSPDAMSEASDSAVLERGF